MTLPAFTSEAVAHRPWPAPRMPWLFAMEWHDLAFLHWPVRADLLRPLIPASLDLQQFDGTAWLGIVPFMMRGPRPRFGPFLAGLSRFAELNVRTYVTAGDMAGVWFFSLDAASKVAVRAARRLFRLPYFDAQMEFHQHNEILQFRSRRTHHRALAANFAVDYAPCSPVFQAEIGSIEHWLTERYCLYSATKGGRLLRGHVHHDPWPLQNARCEITCNTMSQQLGFDLLRPPSLVHFAKRLDVVAWYVERA